jgi:hypothetical protein
METAGEVARPVGDVAEDVAADVDGATIAAVRVDAAAEGERSGAPPDAACVLALVARRRPRFTMSMA